ncbi:hypothetical protein [Streptomyces fagopyri]|uniref:hypothetical protein n=1 Tax=Streptomyces fagopyri TaxID=2662397 RepID=UPI001D1741B4|nr:hypothetical protein [Streptomyces fagopyri]
MFEIAASDKIADTGPGRQIFAGKAEVTASPPGASGFPTHLSVQDIRPRGSVELYRFVGIDLST